MTRIFFSAGESSGDIHGANLVRALRRLEPTVECEGLGGQRMAGAGMNLHYDLAGEGIMGFTEVVKSLGKIRRLFLETLARLESSRPDALVVIDYPGFNIRLATKAARLGIPVIYYISPQVWAWRKKRIYTIAKAVKKMLVIFPFEEALYHQIGVDCSFVGHPLLDHIAAFQPEGTYAGQLIIGLLPGSREQEIQRHLSVMLETAKGIQEEYPSARFIAPCVDRLREAQVRAAAGSFPLETVVGPTFEVLSAARFCMVASGTATLETALFNVPMLIIYKVSKISYWLARRLVNLKHIGIVNILAGSGIVPEFVQEQADAKKILPTALELIADTPSRQTMLTRLAQVCATLGKAGASEHAAVEVLRIARSAAS